MNKIVKKEFSTDFFGKRINFNLGELAKQASGSIFVNFGNTDFLITVVAKELEEEKDFCPLTINYEEKMYSMGDIPGNYLRREGRATEKATLNARIIDRPLRPLLPGNYNQEVQVVITILGYDKDYEADMLSISAVSLAMVMGGIHLKELVAGLTLGMKDGKYIVNPTFLERQNLDFELKVAGTKKALNMVELKGNEVSEEEVLSGLDYAHSKIKELIEFQEKILAFYDKKILKYIPSSRYSPEEFDSINLEYSDIIENILADTLDRTIRGDKLKEVKEEIINALNKDFFEQELLLLKKKVNKIVDKIVYDKFVKLIVTDKYRVDGRNLDEIRKLSSRVSVLKKTHGSSLFTRGETQSLATVTLGMKKDEQLLDGLEDIKTKRFLLHYNFRPFSVGEVGRMGAPGRREIGHGSLAEKAILPILPTEEEFPYTIRVVSEILESNGSSSQATICASTLALMDAGVPIKKPVAGIAMGLVKTDEDFTILTDIAGLEDHLGDMDFKVAGTEDGITAIQMDIKIDGIDGEIFRQGLDQAKEGRLKILQHMKEIIEKPRLALNKNAPKIIKINIDPSKIKEVIGRGGEMINKIIEQTDVQIDIDDDGMVLIYGDKQENAQKAKKIIESVAKIYKKDEVYNAMVTRIEKYGAFVKFDNVEALIHISDLSDKRVEKVEEVLKLNDHVKIKIKDVDQKNRIKASLLEK